MLFSFIIPTYNRANLIPLTIQSLLNQTEEDFEIIVVDDGSVDDTEIVVKKIGSDKITYVKIDNSERGFARNYGANLAKGDYINFFDSDDIALDNHLFEARKMIVLHTQPEVFHLNYAVKNINTGQVINKKWRDYKVSNFIFEGNPLSCNGVFLRKDIALKYPFNPSRKLSVSEDWDLWLKLSARFPIHLSDVVTSYIINHSARSVFSFNEEKNIERMKELLLSLNSDSLFVSKFKNKLYKIEAHMYSYFSIHAILAGHRFKGLKYITKAIIINPNEIFTKRFLAIIKHLLIFV
jgi:glycosyltransferase involved in cell wall biosynthesis